VDITTGVGRAGLPVIGLGTWQLRGSIDPEQV
jgi:hypothetical protein